MPGVDAGTLLESTGDRPIARLTFVADGGAAPFGCDVISSASGRRLSIAGRTFVMDAGWLRYFGRAPATAPVASP